MTFRDKRGDGPQLSIGGGITMLQRGVRGGGVGGGVNPTQGRMNSGGVMLD